MGAVVSGTDDHFGTGSPPRDDAKKKSGFLGGDHTEGKIMSSPKEPKSQSKKLSSDLDNKTAE